MSEIEPGKHVRIVSEEAAAREGIEAGAGGAVICRSWKVRDGFVVKCDDDVQRHFCADELQLVLRRKKEEMHESEAATVSLRCVVCGKHDELDAKDSDALLGKRYRCATCKGHPKKQRTRKPNLAILGMDGAPKSLSMDLIFTFDPRDKPETKTLLDAPLKEEQSENPKPEIDLELLNTKYVATHPKIIEGFQEIVRRLLATPEMHNCGSELERLAFFKVQAEGKALRRVATEIKVSKSSVPGLVAAFKKKMFQRVRAVLLNQQGWSSEFAAIAGPLHIALNGIDCDGDTDSWVATREDYGELKRGPEVKALLGDRQAAVKLKDRPDFDDYSDESGA